MKAFLMMHWMDVNKFIVPKTWNMTYKEGVKEWEQNMSEDHET